MQSHLELVGIRKSYGGPEPALQDISLTAQEGEVVALLGPSGCGKTTLLNVIAGFLRPDEGAVRVHGKDVIDLPPHRRQMGMVFQSYALFPHLTVRRNVSFGLEMHGIKGAEAERRCREALALAQMTGFEDRLPQALSGGQQQRVAVARALAVQPLILLLDEPLSNLDALLRKTMREDLRQLLKKVGTTTLMVTHDQEEALVIADRIILMSNGRIEQIATPRELYERPRTVFAARFMDVANLVAGSVREASAAGTVLDTPFGVVRADASEAKAGEQVTFGIRPESIGLARPEHENQMLGRIARQSYHGAVRRLEVAPNGSAEALVAHLPATGSFHEGDEISVSWPAAATRVFLH